MNRTARMIVTAVIALSSLLALVPPASAASPVTVRGQVMCASHNAVVGVWVQAENGGSGWATRTNINGYTQSYSFYLRYGGRYQVHVGCGGSQQYWATNNKSGYVGGTYNSFTCQDIRTWYSWSTYLRGN